MSKPLIADAGDQTDGRIGRALRDLLEHVFWWSWATEDIATEGLKHVSPLTGCGLLDGCCRAYSLCFVFRVCECGTSGCGTSHSKISSSQSAVYREIVRSQDNHERAEELCRSGKVTNLMVKDRRERWQVVAQQIEEVAMLDRGMEPIYDGGHVFVGCASRGGSVTKTLTA